MLSSLRQIRWNWRYAIRSYLGGSMWLVPILALVANQAFRLVVQAIGERLLQAGLLDDSTSFLGLSVSGARSLLETVVTLNLSFLVFTFGSLLIAIQVAGGQYTPRIIATLLLRENVIRGTVGCFVFALVFALQVLARTGESVHQFDIFVAALLGIVSLMAFLYLIDYAARLLRPVSIVTRVGQLGMEVISTVYPNRTTRPRPASEIRRMGHPERIVLHTNTSGVVLAANVKGLVSGARRANGIIEFVPLVGDFLAVGQPLFRLYGGAGAIADRQLRGAVALGTERTLEQDPTFAFRILVDIAIKALSPAINDPTTAVMSIDQLQVLLRLVGLRDLRSDEVRDKSGDLRLIFGTPNWEDYVHLSCTEIRHCGAGSIQIVRRMRSMLENLMQTLPTHRHAELRRQLELLNRAVDANYAFPEDRALARIPDPQGLGGASGVRPLDEAPNSEG